MTTSDNLRKSAKRWLKALRDGSDDARARLMRAYPGAPAQPTLRDVQHALARERGYESWAALIQSADAEGASDSPLTSLLSAARSGDAARVGAILDGHPEIIDERGTLAGSSGQRTALHFGIAHESVVRVLLDRGANPNIRDEGDNAYPLHFAAERGNLAIVRLLVEHGADPVGAGTTHNLDVLGWAVCFDDTTRREVAEYLLAHGAVHTLLTAVAMGDVEAIRRLAASGADLNQRMDRTNRRRTPLHLAIVKTQPAALATLIELGAELDVQDASGLTPLDHATFAGETEMTRMLLDGGAPLTLPAAIVLHRQDDVDRLLRDSPELLSRTNERRWAQILVYASMRSRGHVIGTLLRGMRQPRAGLSVVNVADDQETAVDGVTGYTALHAAAFHGNDEAVDVLLRNGANPRARDGRYCGTPAGWAAFAGHSQTADRILQADVDLFDAIQFDRADRIRSILERDPEALDRPFSAYASCGARDDQWWPTPECTPLEWAIAREKRHAIETLREYAGSRRPRDVVQRSSHAALFLKAACWDHEVHGRASHRMADRAAQRQLSAEPSIARDSIYTAVVCGDRDEVARILAANPDAARMRGGARGWSPILYLAYTRFTHRPTIENAIAIATMLLDAGADPNDFYMAGDARYSVLVGAAGEGEQDAPRQPYAAALFELLLERGAEPFDIQVLYNTHFSGDMQWWLELVYARTIGTPRGSLWHDPRWPMFDMGNYGSGARFVLDVAIKTHHAELAAWALARGADPNAPPARDRRFPQRTLYELALTHGEPHVADLLVRHGASVPPSPGDDHDQFFAACLTLDRDTARRLVDLHPEYLRNPDVMIAAAKWDRVDVLALLVDLGFSVDVADGMGQRALHVAAPRAIEFLIEHGSDVDARERRFNGTPIGWAVYGQRHDAIAALARYSRDIWNLSWSGMSDRVRDLLKDDPQLARASREGGETPLWWLPDDEDVAMQIADMLIAAGADPKARNIAGETAADAARRRGMQQLAAYLDRRRS